MICATATAPHQRGSVISVISHCIEPLTQTAAGAATKQTPSTSGAKPSLVRGSASSQRMAASAKPAATASAITEANRYNPAAVGPSIEPTRKRGSCLSTAANAGAIAAAGSVANSSRTWRPE
ncbi:MAG TPA: hypothetical protein VFA12_10365 [Stellaceae bacterium]|nr:hypothetical protein [Stellaceae bacterium]